MSMKSAAFALLVGTGIACGAADFVIVSPPDLRAAWEVYAQRRHALQPGLGIIVTGTDAIYAAYPFGAGLACRNAAESVHAFIREAAQAGTTHFLLGGMWLDAREGTTNELSFATGEKLSLSNCVPGICVNPYTGDKGGDIPSDMFYACLGDVTNGIAHPWDPNGDGVYLSADDFPSCDCVPDVAVGRFAAVPHSYGGTTNLLSPSELVRAYADKVARGMQPSFAGLHRVGVASGAMMRTYAPGSREFGRSGQDICFYDDVPNLWSPAHPDPVADTECAVREMFRTVIAPNWPLLEVEALHGTGSAFAARHGDWASARAAFYANDMLFATCRSHGTATAASGVDLTRNFYAQATGLTFFGDFCVPCLTGSLTLTQRKNGQTVVMPSLGVTATCSPAGGLLAGVFNSRYGWISEVNSTAVSDGLSGTLAQNLARRLFVSGDATFGLAHLHARQEYVAAYALTGTRVYALCEQMLYGDPTLGFPAAEKAHAWTGDVCVTGDVSLVAANFTGDANVSGTGRFKVMDSLVCNGTNLSFSVQGGIGCSLAFTGVSPGALTFSDAPFYVGGLSNCASVAMQGGGKVLDATRNGGAFTTLTVDGHGTMGATNVLRCSASGALSALATIPVRSATLALETAEAFGAGDVPLAAVTNGALRLSPGPLRAWPDGTEHLARPVQLASSSLEVEAGASVFFGMRDSSGLHPFRLDVDGTCALASASSAEASAGLVGTTTVALAEGSSLRMDLDVRDADAGGLVFAGPGTAHAAVNALAGFVEVRQGAALELAATPLPAVTMLVVRAGCTLRIPSEPTGLHAVLTGTGRLVVEDGAVVENLQGDVLAGHAMNGMFFEAGAALCWRGGAGAWSDAEGWYDVVTGRTGAWVVGRIAVFTDVSDVTNDCAGVEIRGFVLHGDVTLRGEEIHLADCFMDVPSNRTVSISAPISSTNDFVKAGTGSLILHGAQALSGGIAVRAGVLGLDGVTAPLVTNIAAEVGSRLALRGDSSFVRATAHAAIAAGALCRMADEPTSLELEDFLPANRFALPDGITVRATSAYGLWKMTVNGCLECRTPPAMCINSWIDGAGTVRTAGLWTDTTAYARFSFCRVEMAPGEFQVMGNPGTGVMRRQPKNFLFDGVTLATDGGDVHVTNSDLPDGLVTMCVNTNGVVFDTSDTIFFDDPCATNLYFHGPGDVTKVGAGAVRFTETYDLHEGRTIVEGGTYAVATWSCSSGFVVSGEGAAVEYSGEVYEGAVSVGAGGVFDLSDPAVSVVVATNLQLAAGAVVKVSVTPEGCDVIDASEGTCDLPVDGDVVLDVRIQPNTPPGLYPVIAFPAAATGRWSGRFMVPGGQSAELVFSNDRKALSVRVRRAATVLYIR